MELRILSVLLLVSFSAMALDSGDQIDYKSYETRATADVVIEIALQSELEVRDYLSSFAEANDYRVHIARVHPRLPKFSIQLWRRDSMIVGVNPFELSEFRFSIYPSISESIGNEEAIFLLNQLQGFENDA